MRVITGTAKGRRLKTPKGLTTRPTSDRVKESLFNIIGPQIAQAKFLDLYAGTGAIGIEAISRGADKSVFVEKKPQSARLIRQNLELTGLQEKAEILCLEANKAVRDLANTGRRFDIIFLDPPYLQDLVNKSLIEIEQYKALASGGLIISESSRLDVLLLQVGQLKLFRQERYGDTVLSFYQET